MFPLKIDNSRVVIRHNELTQLAWIGYVDREKREFYQFYEGKVNSHWLPDGHGAFYKADRVSLIEQGYYKKGILQNISALTSPFFRSSSFPPCWRVSKIPAIDVPYRVGPKMLNLGSIYWGQLFNEKPEGWGILKRKDGTVYVGEFKNHQFRGKIRYRDGSTLEGTLENDKAHGIATQVTSEFSYTGSFFEGRRHGAGKMSWPDGRVYEGEFTEGRIEGRGKYTFPNGDTYTGELKDGEFHGQGTLIKRESTYTGSFIRGKKKGVAKIRWSNGDTYTGEVWHGKPNGYGTFTSSEGIIQTGFFHKGKLLKIS